MIPPRKIFFSVLWAGAAILAVSYVQFRFDRSDLNKARDAVLAKEPDAMDCRASFISRWRGHVKVRCQKSEWVVDVVKGTIIYPASPSSFSR